MANYSSSYTGAQIDSAVSRANSTDVTAGTVTASKAVVVDANSDISGFRNITATGQIQAATINLTGDTTIGDGDTDNITINADVNSNIIPNTDNTFDLGSATKQWKDLYVNGIGYIDQLGTDADPIAIYASSGEIDGTVIGSESAAAGTFTTLTASGDVNFDSNTLFVDASENRVGIGETSPAVPLHITGGNLRLDHTRPMIQFEETDGTADQNWQLDVAAGVFRFQTNNDAFSSADTKVVIDQSGSVGIGTTSPYSPLNVHHATDPSISITNARSGANNRNWSLRTEVHADGDFTIRNVATGSDPDAGTSRLVIDRDGSVGIGETSPQAKLHIVDSSNQIRLATDGTSGHAMFSHRSDDKFSIYSFDGSSYTDILLGVDGSNTGGNVGIGTASPTNALLEVQTDDENIARFDGLQGNIDFRYGSDIEFDRAGQVYITANNASGELNFRTGGQNIRMHIDSSGSVGIGTTSPSSFNANTNNLVIRDSGSGGMTVSTGASSTGYYAFNNGVDTTIEGLIAYNHSNNTMSFRTNTTDDRLVIDSSGQVGIGTSSPASTLEVAGKLTVDDSNAYIDLKRSGTTISTIGADATGEFIVYDTSASAYRMVINSSGSVGIGTTSPAKELHLEGAEPTFRIYDSTASKYFDMFLASGGGVSQLRFDSETNSNTLVLGNNNHVGIGTANPDSKLHLENSSGDLDFRMENTASSSTNFLIRNGGGNNRIDFSTTSTTNMVTFTDGGNVGIGTTSPGEKLDVRVSSSGNYVASFYNTPDTSDAYGIKVQCGQQAGSGTTYFFKALESDAGDTGDLRTVSGTFQLSDNSDSRLKDNIRDTEINGLDTVNSMKVRDFEWKNNESTVLAGFVAQELKESFEPASPDDEDAVDEDGNPIMMAISRERLVPVLVKAIQELSAKVEALENA